MKTALRYLGLNAHANWQRQVDCQLAYLQNLTAISAAQVVMEHQRDVQPAFRVCLRLEVPGPALHPQATRRARQAALQIPGPALQAEARDNTIEAALLKVTQELKHQIQGHKARISERSKSKLQSSARSSRWTYVQSGRRS